MISGMHKIGPADQTPLGLGLRRLMADACDVALIRTGYPSISAFLQAFIDLRGSTKPWLRIYCVPRLNCMPRHMPGRLVLSCNAIAARVLETGADDLPPFVASPPGVTLHLHLEADLAAAAQRRTELEAVYRELLPCAGRS